MAVRTEVRREARRIGKGRQDIGDTVFNGPVAALATLVLLIVPQPHWEGMLALGATRWEAIRVQIALWLMVITVGVNVVARLLVWRLNRGNTGTRV